jgi:hypothetical protein
MRAMDDSFNYPLSLLLARLRAISGEADRFTTISGRLLDILLNETRSLPRRANEMLARAGEDRRRASPGPKFHGSSRPDHIYIYVASPATAGTGHNGRGYQAEKSAGRNHMACFPVSLFSGQEDRDRWEFRSIYIDHRDRFPSRMRVQGRACMPEDIAAGSCQ